LSTYVLFAVACGGLAWLASLCLTLQRRVTDLERLVDQQRTSTELNDLRQSVGEMIDELRRVAKDIVESALTRQGDATLPWGDKGATGSGEVKRDVVLRLATEGLSNKEIAKRTQLELSAVELALRLNGDRGAPTNGDRSRTTYVQPTSLQGG